MIPDVQIELELRNRQINAVFEITRALHEQTDSDTLIKKTLLTTLTIVNATAGSLLLYDDKKEGLVFRYVIGEKANELLNTTIKPNQGIAGEVFQTGKSRLIEDISKEMRHLKSVDERTGFMTRDMITVPLKSIEDKPIGVMQVLNKKEGSLNASDMKVAEIMAVLAATAIENAHLQETQRLAAVATMVGNISHDLKNMLTPVDNAISATPKGGSVTIETKLITDTAFPQSQCLALSISDTGGGIPAHVLERLFTDKAISTKPGGTGFGTRIVKNVVDSHKGKIEVASQEGKGTTFTIKLPL